MVTVQFLFGVQIRVGLEVDLRHVACDTGIDVHCEVLHRTGGQHVEPADRRTEPNLVVEHHDVDRRPEKAATTTQDARIPSYVLVPVPLVT
ncbi:hypothetical protein MLGJGCBP_03097 [Rhodococcus sp. T7]|nr:hypothetical protein MLGJGCBP_03097 [Rhodococcus sp. T7]